MTASTAIQVAEGAIFAPFHGLLVETEGDVVDVLQHSQQQLLLLRDRDTFFQARIDETEKSESERSISPGMRIRVTGVCLTESDENQQPRAFYLLVRSPAEVTILRAPWGRIGSALWVFGGLLAAAFGLLVCALSQVFPDIRLAGSSDRIYGPGRRLDAGDCMPEKFGSGSRSNETDSGTGGCANGFRFMDRGRESSQDLQMASAGVRDRAHICFGRIDDTSSTSGQR